MINYELFLLASCGFYACIDNAAKLINFLGSKT